MKVFITKYALSEGIIETDAEDKGDGVIAVKTEKNWYRHYYLGEGKQWDRTREAAVARAEQMRLTKIKSLQKQIERLEKLRFSD